MPPPPPTYCGRGGVSGIWNRAKEHLGPAQRRIGEKVNLVIGKTNNRLIKSYFLVEVIVPPGQRPRAGIGKKNLRDVAAAIKAHGKSCAQAIEPITRFFAYLSAGEALETEVEQLLDPFPDRANAQWDTNFGKLDTDLEMIVKLAQEAGFDHRQDLLSEGWNRANAIIADNRAAYEAFVIRLFDGGNIEQPELDEYFPALPA